MSRQANRESKIPEANKASLIEPQQIVGQFRLDKVIGQGTYGKVRLGVHAETGEQVAIKVIEKAQIQSPKQVARLQREIRFLKLLNHPHIVKVIDVIETHDFIYIIMEYAVGGELFDYIVANKRVKEKEARSFFRMVLSAVDYCHQNAIIHRDLKPENLLLDDKKNIKIIDFGFGNNFSHTGLLDTFCGSPFYAAPEMILGKKYEGPEVDMWSLGVILFALLCGHLPFDDDNMKELYKKIANGIYKTPDHMPAGARHLIGRLITVDPKKRATLKEVLQHPWINEGFEFAPQNYLPKRLFIKEASSLSKDITNRLEIFGYTKQEIEGAFSMDEDYTKPNAIRSTYHLLSEMVIREQARLRQQRRAAQQKLAASNTSIFNSTNTLSNSTDASISSSSLSGIQHHTEINQDVDMLSSSTNSNGAPTSPSPPPFSPPPPHSQPNAGYTRSDVTKRVPQPRSVSYHPGGGSHNVQDRIQFSQQQQLSDAGCASQSSSSFGINSYRESVLSSTGTVRPSTTSQGGNIPIGSSSRRQSVPLMLQNDPSTFKATPNGGSSNGSNSNVNHTSTSTTEKFKEELRAVSGWFLNFSTTTNKSQQDVLAQFYTILGSQLVRFNPEDSTRSMFQCEVDLNSLQHLDGGGSSNNGGYNAKPQMIGFQVEISKVPRMNLNAIHFKRISGHWLSYKKVCNKLLSKLSL